MTGRPDARSSPDSGMSARRMTIAYGTFMPELYAFGRIGESVRRRRFGLARHGNEAHWQHRVLRDVALLVLGEDLELLVEVAHRDDHAPVGRELLQQRLRRDTGSRRDEDAVERRLLGPPPVAVPDAEEHVCAPERFQPLLRPGREIGQDL